MSGGYKAVGTVSVKVMPDTGEFKEKLKGELKSATEGVDAKVDILPDLSRFREELKSKLTAETEGTKSEVKVHVAPDMVGFRERLKARLEEATAGEHVRVKVASDFDRNGLGTKVKLAALEAGTSVRVRSNFDRGFGGAGGLGFGGSFNQIANLGSLPNLLAIFAILPPALAIIAPALASLPALFAAVATPIGALVLGMGGLKKAAEDAGALTSVFDKKGNPTNKLTIGGALKDIQSGVSDVFAKGFTPVFSQLLTAAGPVKLALQGIASGISNMAQGIANTLTSPAVVNKFNTLFANISGAISAATPGMQSFTTGLIDLATKVSTHFPGLVNWFNSMGDKFSAWVTKISGDGTLDKGISSLRGVMDAIIGFLGRLFDAGMKFASDKKMQQSIADVLNGVSNFIINALPPLAQFFNSIAPLVRDLGLIKVPAGTTPGDAGPQQQGQHGQPLFPNIKVDDKSLIEDFKKLVGIGKKPFDFAQEHIGGPIQRFATGDTQWQKGLQHAGGAMFDADLGALKSAAGGAQKVAGEIVSALSSIPGRVAGIWSQITSGAAHAWSSLVSAAQQAAGRVIAVFQSLPGQILGILSSLGGQLFAAGSAAMGRLADGIRAGINKVKAAGHDALNAFLSLIPHSPAKEGPLSGSGWTNLYTGGQAMGNQFKDGLENGFTGVVSSASNVLKRVRETLAGGGKLSPDLVGSVQDQLQQVQGLYDQYSRNKQLLDPSDKEGRKNLDAQLKQLRELKTGLSAGLEQAGVGGSKPGDQVGDKTLQTFGEQVPKMVDLAKNFGMANISQFESDLGISGNGAIPTIANLGLNWATSTVNGLLSHIMTPQQAQGPVNIHVNSVDDAMAARQNMLNKQALGVVGR